MDKVRNDKVDSDSDHENHKHKKDDSKNENAEDQLDKIHRFE